MRRLLGRLMVLAIFVTVVLGLVALTRRSRSRTDTTRLDGASRPEPPRQSPSAPGADRAPETTAPTAGASGGTAPEPAPPWVEPEDGECPASHPLKAKLRSGIFHAPGGRNYERTKADRCYCDEQAASADGLRASKI